MRRTNKAVNQRAEEMRDKFIELRDMFSRFVSLKKHVPKQTGKIQLRAHDGPSMAFVMNPASWDYAPSTRPLSLGIADLRDVPKHKKSDNPVAPAPVMPFLEKLHQMNDPSIKDPKIWLWITADTWDDAAAAAFIGVHFKDWEYKQSVYKACKAERLYDIPIRQAALPSVNLHFFYQRDVPSYIPGLIKPEYVAPNIAYYNDPRENHESKFRSRSSELRMEFYLDIIQNFASPGENFFGVYTGAKCMLAAKVVTPSIGGLLSSTRR